MHFFRSILATLATMAALGAAIPVAVPDGPPNSDISPEIWAGYQGTYTFDAALYSVFSFRPSMPCDRHSETLDIGLLAQ